MAETIATLTLASIRRIIGIAYDPRTDQIDYALGAQPHTADHSFRERKAVRLLECVPVIGWGPWTHRISVEYGDGVIGDYLAK